LLAAAPAWRENSFPRERAFRFTIVFCGNLETDLVFQEILSMISAMERFML
jgi:hypothetical protein